MSPISASSSDSENTVTISANVYEALGIPQFKAMHRKSALMAHIATALANGRIRKTLVLHALQVDEAKLQQLLAYEKLPSVKEAVLLGLVQRLHPGFDYAGLQREASTPSYAYQLSAGA